MKNVLKFFAASLAMSALLPGAWAGVDYSKYNEEYKAEKSSASQAEEGKRFEHSSKYQREMPATENTLPTKERDLNRPTPRSDVTK